MRRFLISSIAFPWALLCACDVPLPSADAAATDASRDAALDQSQHQDAADDMSSAQDLAVPAPDLAGPCTGHEAGFVCRQALGLCEAA